VSGRKLNQGIKSVAKDTRDCGQQKRMANDNKVEVSRGSVGVPIEAVAKDTDALPLVICCCICIHSLDDQPGRQRAKPRCMSHAEPPLKMLS
jgi:hypothetical protein